MPLLVLPWPHWWYSSRAGHSYYDGCKRLGLVVAVVADGERIEAHLSSWSQKKG